MYSCQANCPARCGSAERDGHKVKVELEEKLALEYDQRRALYCYCRKLGSPEVSQLHVTSHRNPSRNR